MRDILGSAGAVLLAIAIGVGAVAAIGTPRLYGPPGAAFRASFPLAVHKIAPGSLGIAPEELGGARVVAYAAGDVTAEAVGLPGYAVLAVAGSASSSPLVARVDRAVAQLCAYRGEIRLPKGASLRCSRTSEGSSYVITGPAGAIERPASFPAGARGGEEVVAAHGAVYLLVAVTSSEAALDRFLGSFVPLGGGD